MIVSAWHRDIMLFLSSDICTFCKSLWIKALPNALNVTSLLTNLTVETQLIVFLAS